MVSDIPKIIQFSPEEPSFIRSEGEKLRLSCQAEAVATAEVVWFSYDEDPSRNRVFVSASNAQSLTKLI